MHCRYNVRGVLVVFTCGAHLKVDHVPEALQVVTRGGLETSAELAVIDESAELLKALRHQELCLADGRAHLTAH